MWFDAQAELEKLGRERESDTNSPATIATSATRRARVAIVADVAAPNAPGVTFLPQSQPAAEFATSSTQKAKPDGFTVGGRTITWTGRVVSLDAWRRLSKWEKNGPNGRVWNGLLRGWDGSSEQ